MNDSIPGDGAAGFQERVYLWIGRIPRGRVATYGQIARLAGFPRRARHVGQALAHPPPRLKLPWHRVINAQGRISRRSEASQPGSREPAEARQRRLLEQEGVEFRGERVVLRNHLWDPAESHDWI